MRRIQRTTYTSRLNAGLFVLAAVALSAGAALSQVSAGSSVIDLAIEPADLTVHVDDAPDYLGSSVASGDVNGDGVDDLIIGSFGADPAGRLDAGELYIVYGSEGLASLVDIPQTGADITISGATAGDFFGFATASGDVNGDGIDDIIVTARLNDPNGRNDAGQTYVFFGSPSLPPSVDLNVARADVEIHGADVGDQSGYSLATGDLNNDGIADIIIGAFLGDRPERTNAGETAVLYGRVEWPTNVDLRDAENAFFVYGRDPEDRSGWAVASGDLNGDTIDDLIIGARFAEPPGDDERGETYVVFGSPTSLASIDLLTDSPDLTVYGRDNGDRSANSVAAGDVNGDGIDDLLIGAHHASPSGGSNAGEMYVLFGSTTLPSIIDLTTSDPDVTMLGDDPFDHFGVTVLAADVTADGILDLIIGAFGGDGPPTTIFCGNEQPCFSKGEVHIQMGGAVLPELIDLNVDVVDISIYGDRERGFSGYTLAAGDLNGDTVDDLIVGARLANANVGGSAGDIHVLFGGPAGIGSPCLACPTVTTQPPLPTFAPAPTATPILIQTGLLGDVNCDEAVNSVDALLVLQFTAALVGSLDCLAAGDLNADLNVDSLDAALILQIVAGISIS